MTHYNPNEDELKIANIKTYHAQLLACKDEVTATQSKLNATRIQRNQLLYQPETGLVPIAKAVKQYVKSVYSRYAPEYKPFARLRFVNFG